MWPGASTGVWSGKPADPSGDPPGSGSRGRLIARALLDLGVGIAQLRQVRRARPGVQLGQQAVVARAGLGLADVGVAVVQVAEDDRAGRAGRLAGGLHLVAADPLLAPDLRRDPRLVDPLHAVRALLHHPARPDRHVGVAHQLQARRRLVGVLEEVEPPDLVRAVVRAVPRADAAVVRHLVEPLGAVRVVAPTGQTISQGAVLAVLARHRLEVDVGVGRRPPRSSGRSAASASRARPGPAPPDDRDVVLGVAGRDAGVAADAGVEVDRHPPGVPLALLADGAGAPGRRRGSRPRSLAAGLPSTSCQWSSLCSLANSGWLW